MTEGQMRGRRRRHARVLPGSLRAGRRPLAVLDRGPRERESRTARHDQTAMTNGQVLMRRWEKNGAGAPHIPSNTGHSKLVICHYRLARGPSRFGAAASASILSAKFSLTTMGVRDLSCASPHSSYDSRDVGAVAAIERVTFAGRPGLCRPSRPAGRLLSSQTPPRRHVGCRRSDHRRDPWLRRGRGERALGRDGRH